MPPRKRTSTVRAASESESEEEEVKPKVKRQSTSASKVNNEEDIDIPDSKNAGAMEKNEQGEQYMKLSESRRLTVRTYNKKVLVDMREYYKDKTTGEQKPGSKGISLTKEQWTMLKENMDAIDEAVAKIEGDK